MFSKTLEAVPEPWRHAVVWGPVLGMVVVIIVLAVLAGVFGQQAADASGPPHFQTMTAMYPTLVGGQSAAINVMDSNPNTTAFIGYAIPIADGTSFPRLFSKHGAGSKPAGVVTIPHTAQVPQWYTQLDMKGLQPHTSYQALIQSVDYKGVSTCREPLTVFFTTADAASLGPVTGLFVKDITATSPPTFPQTTTPAPGWSTLSVGCDPMQSSVFPQEGISFLITFQGGGEPASTVNLLYDQLPTPISVPSGLPITVSIQPVVSNIRYGTPGYSVGSCLLPSGPVVIAPPVIGSIPPVGPLKFYLDPTYDAPNPAVIPCTLAKK